MGTIWPSFPQPGAVLLSFGAKCHILFIPVTFHLFNLTHHSIPVIHGNSLSFGSLLQMPSVA